MKSLNIICPFLSETQPTEGWTTILKDYLLSLKIQNIQSSRLQLFI